MKKITLLFALLVASVGFSQTNIYQESFETTTNGSNYNTSVAEFSDGAGDFFTRTDGSDIGSYVEYAGADGSFYFGAMDLDGEGATLPVSLSTVSVDVTGLSSIDFVVLLAEDDDGSDQDWDADDYVHITYSLDGGASQNLLWVESEITSGSNGIPRLDTDFDGLGDGAEITSTFTQFSESIDVSGASSIMVTIEYNLNSGDEDLAIDNLRLVDGFAPQPNVTISSPADGDILAPGTTSTDLEFTGSNLPNDATFSVTVNGNTTTNATSPFTINTTNGTTYNVTIDVVSGGGSIANDQISFSVGDATQVADIAALRAGAEDGTFYQVTGEAVITYQQGFRNQKYVQDASGAILIDDTAGNISTSYNVGDGLTGLVGTLSSFNGMLQFVPAGDPGAATSTGNTVTPQILTISEFNTNFENYEAELVAFEDVTFTTADGVITFDNGDSYPIEDAGQNTTLVEALFNLEYTGDIVPTNAVNVVGLAGEENNGEYRIYPRDNDIDVTLSNTSFTNSDVVMYPNPVKGSLVSISINNADTFTVEVYNVLGKQVLKQTANNSTQLNTSGLKSGVYLVKITEGNQSLTKKLIVQ